MFFMHTYTFLKVNTENIMIPEAIGLYSHKQK